MGRDTILAVDCGAYNTTVTPIIDGSIIEKGNCTINITNSNNSRWHWWWKYNLEIILELEKIEPKILKISKL